MRRWLDRVTPGRGTHLDTIRYADGYIPAAFTARCLEGCHRVLVVGDAGGRDSRYLAYLGHEVVQLDLSPQDEVADLIVQSIEDPTPFQDGEFEGVVLNEVIEHLHRDLDALKEIRRIIRPHGVLLLSVPASRRQDRPEYHLRIHTPRTLARLLAAAGFSIVDEYRRGLVTRSAASHLGHVVALAAQIALVHTGSTPEEAIDRVNIPLARFERFVGYHFPIVQHIWTTYGLAVAAVPVDPIDSAAIQLSTFAQTNRLRHA